jgi:SET domain-containing protein
MAPRPFRVARSLTGLGLFATRPIKKKSRIVEYKGPILDSEAADRAERRGNRYLYEISKNRTIDGTPRRNVARYANHSCNPNAESVIWRGRVFIKALRTIKPGDYGTDYLKNVIGRANCKCSRCRRRRAKRAREARALKKRRDARAVSARKSKRKR